MAASELVAQAEAAEVLGLGVGAVKHLLAIGVIPFAWGRNARGARARLIPRAALAGWIAAGRPRPARRRGNRATHARAYDALVRLGERLRAGRPCDS